MSYILDTLPDIHFGDTSDNIKDADLLSALLSNYTYGKKWNVITDLNSQENTITIGDYTVAQAEGDYDYIINATDKGVFVKGNDFSGMMRGFTTLLNKIKYDDSKDLFYIENCCATHKPLVDFRCVHLCIFPETDIDFLKKCVRSCAIAKFSHIIFEFWGMIKLECMKELAWPFAFSKSQIKQIVEEANTLGVEIIPMFNHLGHAAACREINGKHVVLDQNPKYEYMFDSCGWIWKIERDDVKALHKKIRAELTEICGKGRYFHLGCDEAYMYGHNTQKAAYAIDYLNDIAKELKAQGRQPIIWHDMLLATEDFDGYIANSAKDVSELFLEKLSRDIIIADWQYSPHNETWKTAKTLKDNNFSVICCPWSNPQNISEAIDTAKENNLNGIIHTTWHNLFGTFREMIYAGVLSYGEDNLISELNMNKNDIHRFYAAAVARKAMPSYGEYEKCGWSEKMTGPGLV